MKDTKVFEHVHIRVWSKLDIYMKQDDAEMIINQPVHNTTVCGAILDALAILAKRDNVDLVMSILTSYADESYTITDCGTLAIVDIEID